MSGSARVARRISPYGRIEFLEGERGCERVICKVLPDGDVEYYEGEKDSERLVRIVYPSGEVVHYTGDKGYEHVSGSSGMVEEIESDDDYSGMLHINIPSLIEAVKRFTSDDKHDQLNELADRYTSKQVGKQQMQFELRVVAGRDALRQGLLALVPNIDALQQARDVTRQRTSDVSTRAARIRIKLGGVRTLSRAAKQSGGSRGASESSSTCPPSAPA